VVKLETLGDFALWRSEEDGAEAVNPMTLSHTEVLTSKAGVELATVLTTARQYTAWANLVADARGVARPTYSLLAYVYGTRDRFQRARPGPGKRLGM